MPSPQRIFKRATTEEITAARTAAMDRLTNGSFTSLSGGGKSSSRQFSDPSLIIFEADYELSVRSGTVGPSRTSSTFTGILENNITANV
jgi:hypothetical protein